jgi:hypothetical protein
MQSIADIGKAVKHAQIFNARNWCTERLPMEDTLQTVIRLFSLLRERNLNYVLVGGIALLQYIQGRNTEDIDLILNVTTLKKLPEIRITNQDLYFARGVYDGLQIDFLLTKNPLFAYVQKKHAIRQLFLEQTIVSATIRGLLLLKLYALPSLYRQGNFARIGLYENDVATLMYYHRPNIHEILDELTPFVSVQDQAAIRDIVHDLEQRVSRVRDTNEGS